MSLNIIAVFQLNHKQILEKNEKKESIHSSNFWMPYSSKLRLTTFNLK